MRTLTILRILAPVTCLACASAGTPDIDAGAASSTARVGGVSGVTAIERSNTTEAMDVSISAPAARVWAVLPSVFEDLKIPIEAIDTRTMSLGDSQARVRRALGGSPLSKYFGCGINSFGMANADAYSLTMNIIAQVVSVDETHSTLRSRVSATAAQSGMSEHAVSCSSTGDLELRLARLTKEKLGTS